VIIILLVKLVYCSLFLFTEASISPSSGESGLLLLVVVAMQYVLTK
jgi:hypothetical protein